MGSVAGGERCLSDEATRGGGSAAVGQWNGSECEGRATALVDGEEDETRGPASACANGGWLN